MRPAPPIGLGASLFCSTSTLTALDAVLSCLDRSQSLASINMPCDCRAAVWCQFACDLQVQRTPARHCPRAWAAMTAQDAAARTLRFDAMFHDARLRSPAQIRAAQAEQDAVAAAQGAAELARMAARGAPPCDHPQEPGWVVRCPEVVPMHFVCGRADHIHPAHGNAGR